MGENKIPTVVGIMCVRDEADLLPMVLPHVRGLVDYLYVYEDGSQDGTWDLVKNEYYAIRKQDDKHRLVSSRGNYHHLLEKIREDFKGEDVWIVITMGDRFYLNKTPREIVANAVAKGFETVEGVQLDFLRHRMDPWTEENDTYPDYSNIRETARWFKHDERCVVAYKLTPALSYKTAKYPWPRGLNNVQHLFRDMGGEISTDMPYLEHQGRRSPKACMIRYTNGSRGASKKYDYDFSSYARVVETVSKFYWAYKLLPWIDSSSLEEMVSIRNNMSYRGNEGKPALRELYRAKERKYSESPPPPRRDL